MDRRAEVKQQIAEFVGKSTLSISEDNRWVTNATVIPWDALQKECAFMPNDDFRMFFAACLVEAQFGYTDEEAVRQIQESPYLQFFCGLPRFNACASPFPCEQLKRFREGLSDEVLQRMNDIIKNDL